MTEIENLQYELAEERIKVKELEADLEDLLFVSTQFMGVMGIQINELRTGVDTKKVVKAIKSKLFQLATDDEGFAGMFKHFADEAIRVAEKYEHVAQEVTDRKLAEKGL